MFAIEEGKCTCVFSNTPEGREGGGARGGEGGGGGGGRPTHHEPKRFRSERNTREIKRKAPDDEGKDEANDTHEKLRFARGLGLLCSSCNLERNLCEFIVEVFVIDLHLCVRVLGHLLFLLIVVV
jgi:hypothetical protein